MLSGRNVDVRRERRGDESVLGALLAGIAAFQVAAASGAPVGALAWGGAHEGALPPDLRTASAVSALVWGAAAVAVATGRPRAASGRRRLLQGVAVLSGAGVLVNLASPSLPERMVWVPVSAVVAALAWRGARRGRAAPVTGASAAHVG